MNSREKKGKRERIGKHAAIEKKRKRIKRRRGEEEQSTVLASSARIFGEGRKTEGKPRGERKRGWA